APLSTAFQKTCVVPFGITARCSDFFDASTSFADFAFVAASFDGEQLDAAMTSSRATANGERIRTCMASFRARIIKEELRETRAESRARFAFTCKTGSLQIKRVRRSP